MSRLDQIQLSFVAGEDRLLLRVSTTSGEEFRCWLTRRFVKALRPALDQALAAGPRIRAQPDPAVREALLRFEQEKAVASSNFDTPFRETERAMPLGAQPVVLTRGQVRPRPDGGVLLALAPEQGEGLDLALAPELLQSFLALLERTLGASDWDLARSAAAAMPASATVTWN